MKSAARKSPPVRPSVTAAVLDDARNAGLLAGDKTAHISVRTTEALLEEAKRQTGINSTTELVELGLAALAMPDPVTKYMFETVGDLGADHTLES
jgi:hypothetical protein